MRQVSNNKGFTLIELIVALAVMVVIGGCVYGFVSTSTKTYNSVSQDVDLQEEAQLAMNQLESILMNAQNGAFYDEDNKTLYIYNNENRYVIAKGTGDDNSLYYSLEARKKDASDAYINEFETVDTPALMAEYLKDFDVDVDDSGSAVVVNVTMDFEKAKKSYSATQKITLRNTIRLTSDIDAIYAEDEGDSSVLPVYTGITVKLGSEKYTNSTTKAHEVTLTETGDIVIPMSVAIVGSHYPSQSYDATLTGSSVSQESSRSRVEDGKKSIIISKDEEATNLTLTVIASAWPSLQCMITINVKKILGITIGNNITNPDTAFRLGSEITLGSTAASQLYATVNGTGNLSEDDKKFTWEAGDNCKIVGNTLIIDSEESKIGQKFTVIAKSAKSSKTATFSGTITARSTTLVLTADSSTVDRGGSVQFTATDGSKAYPQKDVTYSYSVSGGAAGTSFVLTQGGQLSVSKELDYNKEYTVTVTAALSYKNNVKQSVTVTVPAVTVKFSQTKNGVYSDNITVPMRNLSPKEGRNTYTIYYQITGVKDGKLSDIMWSGSNSEYFGATTKIGDSTIAFKKTSKDFDGKNDNFDYSQFEKLNGTPVIGDAQVTSSGIVVYNKKDKTNITLKKDGEYVSYYIPVEATNGPVSLAGTDIVYSIELITVRESEWYSYTYYRMTISAPNSIENKEYSAWNADSSWSIVYVY